VVGSSVAGLLIAGRRATAYLVTRGWQSGAEKHLSGRHGLRQFGSRIYGDSGTDWKDLDGQGDLARRRWAVPLNL